MTIFFFYFLAGIICLVAVDIKKITRFKYDDACDVFAGKALKDKT